jgi:predicted O-methyltransferase YrrM
MKPSRYQTELLQNRREHEAFVDLLKSEGVRSYLEIGSMYGGSLWRVAHALPKGSRIVSIDYACDTPEALPHLQECIADLIADGYDAHLIVGDSTAEETVAKAKALGPFDALFIDGAHTLEAVTSDWCKYGPMARMVAFHDISWNSTWKSKVPGRVPKPMGVPHLWEQVKQGHRYKEFQYQEPKNYYGIGVLWRE